jgi:hypothetical protein
MSLWTDIRDAVETVAVVVGNYYLPGSSLLTSRLTSKGSQEQLSSDVGMLAQLVAGGYGIAEGNLSNYGKLLGGGGAAPSTAPGATPGTADAFAGVNAETSPYSLTTAPNAPGGIGLSTPSGSTALQPSFQSAKPGVWERIGATLESHPIAVGMAIQGAGAVMAGMGASEQAKVQKEKQDFERQQYERGLQNINAPLHVGANNSGLPFNIKPYKPVSPTAGIINRRVV